MHHPRKAMKIMCALCGGTGRDMAMLYERCRLCKGLGRLTIAGNVALTSCGFCGGTGRDLKDVRGLCELCGGIGQLEENGKPPTIVDVGSVSAVQPLLPSVGGLVADTRLAELRACKASELDFGKLIRLCEELNTAYNQGCYLAVIMLTRGLLDHVPPVFGKKTFKEVANNYGGGKSFGETMQHLDSAARKIADGYLHTPIRKAETLPTSQQVNFGAEIDTLLAEIIRISRSPRV